MTTTPRVLFVCVKNGGKSQMAAGLMRDVAGEAIDVHSGGTAPGTALNELSVKSLAELGIDISEGTPKPITAGDLAVADIVVIVGGEADVETPEGTVLENWETDEPSERGIEGIELRDLIRCPSVWRTVAIRRSRCIRRPAQSRTHLYKPAVDMSPTLQMTRRRTLH